MVTSEERREVAEDIRGFRASYLAGLAETQSVGTPLDYVLLGSVHMRSDDGAMRYPTTDAELLGMLADLIEPGPKRTCSDVGDGSEFECSECKCKVARRASFPDALGNPNWGAAVTLGGREAEIRHCPNCGARVMR